jgi:superfamily II DNA or RNA helicase
MNFTLNSKLILSGMKDQTGRTLRQRLTMDNPQFASMERLGKWTGDTPRRLSFYENTTAGLEIPRGFADQAYHICHGNGEQITIQDERQLLPEVEFNFHGSLRPFQEDAVKDMLKTTQGVLDCPTGGGKTVIALNIIVERKQPTLIICHTRELLAQWVDRAGQFLGVDAKDIGVIGAGKFTIGDKITVGMVQTLCKKVDEVKGRFGHVVVDETHRAPSKTFTDVVGNMDARFIMGLTATPYRRDGLGRVIFLYLGDRRHEVNKDCLVDQGHLCKAQVVWHDTAFDTCLNASENYSRVLSELTQDRKRNRLICKDVAGEVCQGIKLVLSDRKNHCQDLHDILKAEHGLDAVILTGGLSPKDREAVTERISNSTVKILIATGQLIGEGYDLPALETLFLATPIKFGGRLIQYVGRVLRPSPGKDRATIHDYHDINVGVLDNSAKARAYTYQSEGIATA